MPPSTLQLTGPGSVQVPQLQRGLERVLSTAANSAPALVVHTSGSTGTPKATVLSAGALRASAAATAAATNSAGAQWLLCLPVHYVAGAQVLARSVLAGTSPISTASLQPGASFTPQDFLNAALRLGSGPRMVSMVPTQLYELVDAVDPEAVPSPGKPSGPPQETSHRGGPGGFSNELLEALRGFSAILLGGAPASSALLERCQALELPVVTTYGSAETSGGCVYDGSPLPEVQMVLEAGDHGRIWLGGPGIASGYLGDASRTAAHFRLGPNGTRWYRTEDLGTLNPDGRLQILGRADDTLISGGVKVSPRAVEQALEADARVREALVVGLPDPRWGTRIEAMITRAQSVQHPPSSSTSDQDLLDILRTAVRERLGAPAAPRRLHVVERLPSTSTGKPDRRAAARQLAMPPEPDADLPGEKTQSSRREAPR